MKRVLCFGDSNTWGYEPQVGTRYDETVRWTGRLQQHLPQARIIEEGLNGRTAVWEDPIEEHRNGKSYLLPCLLSQAPLDLVILMLGTNDCKSRFGLTSSDVAAGVRTLGQIILASDAGRAGKAPKLLIVCPPFLQYQREADYLCSFNDISHTVAKELPIKYQRLTAELGCAYLDLSDKITPSPRDGIHLEPDEHKKIALLLKDLVPTLW